jgi:hypothetical protein
LKAKVDEGEVLEKCELMKAKADEGEVLEKCED